MTTIKLLIFSDSHGKVGSMLELAEQVRPDEIIHLGDHLRDAESLSFALPDIPVTMVPGNCDGWTGRPGELLLERGGHKLLLGHGHQWRVKFGSHLALSYAREKGANVLLYGHTHQAVCRWKYGILLLNPGTAGGSGARATYGVLDLSASVPNGRIVCME